MASGPIFTDTSAWYAYIDKSDTEHAAAVKLVKNLDRPLITSNYIFDEVLTLVKNGISCCYKFWPKVAEPGCCWFGEINQSG